MKIHQLFSVPLAEFHNPEAAQLNPRLGKLFLERESCGDKYRDPHKRDTQSQEVFESRFDLFTWPEPEVREVAGFVHRSLSRLLVSIGNFDEASFRKLKFVYDAWFHVTRTGGYQGVHNHPNASWSGIYCVDPGDNLETQPDSGVVRMIDPKANATFYADAGSEQLKMPFTLGGAQIRHEAGKLVIFPSYLLHEVFAYTGKRPRIVIAFNCQVRRS